MFVSNWVWFRKLKNDATEFRIELFRQINDGCNLPGPVDNKDVKHYTSKKLKVKVTLEQAPKPQREIKDIALLFP